jgi:hypothetical protein
MAAGDALWFLLPPTPCLEGSKRWSSLGAAFPNQLMRDFAMRGQV